MASDTDQSKELSVLDADDGNVSPNFPENILKNWLYN